MIFNNVAGIGDIIFCEPIYRYSITQTGEKPFVIVHDHHLWIQEYIDSAVFLPASANLHLKDKSENGPHYISLRFANQIHRGLLPHDHSDLENMMLDKYRMLGLPEELWKTINLNFNSDKGHAIVKKLNMSLLDEYTLRNEYCQIGKIEIPLTKNKLVVDMVPLPGFSVIDWYLIHAQADGIHTVSTSTFFLMQALMNKGWLPPDIYIYPRPNEDGLRGISQLKPDFNLTLVV